MFSKEDSPDSKPAITQLLLAGSRGTPSCQFFFVDQPFTLSPHGRPRTIHHHGEPPVKPTPDGQSGPAIFEILIREHADMLVAYLRSLNGADPGVDDLFQQTMLVAWRRLDDYDRSRPFGPWLRGIAHRLTLEHHRRGMASGRIGRALCTDPAVLAELDIRFEQVSRLSGDTFRERIDRLNECLAKLPELMRQSIEMVYMRGMLMAAVAESTDATEEAVKKRVQRGRQLLAQCLGVGDPTP